MHTFKMKQKTQSAAAAATFTNMNSHRTHTNSVDTYTGYSASAAVLQIADYALTYIIDFCMVFDLLYAELLYISTLFLTKESQIL